MYQYPQEINQHPYLKHPNQKLDRYSGVFTETEADYYDYYNAALQNSQLQNRTYLTDAHPFSYQNDQPVYSQRQQPQQHYFDPNDPINIPYLPNSKYEDEYEEYTLQFIKNLPRATSNFEEVAFAKYLAECSILDRNIYGLQSILKSDQRFNVKLLFDYFDTKSNKQIDFSEFQLGMQKLDIMLNQVELQQLFLRYGGSDDNQISSVEFKYMLIGPDDAREFMQFGALHYMHHPLKQNIPQFFSVAQRDTIHDIMQLQVQLERNLNFIREVIGEQQILLPLFRQLDNGQKGYITMRDLIIYMNELGGAFEEQDLKGCIGRMSKMNCQRINFKEFRQEFYLDKQQKHEIERNKDTVGDRKRYRQKDYIQEMKEQLQQKEQQEQQKESEKKIKPLTQTSKPQQVQPYVIQPAKLPAKKKAESIDDDYDDLLFPGFQKYQLQAPDDE